MEGDEAVQDLVFLDKRTKSKLSASLVASGPAGLYTEACISKSHVSNLFRPHSLLEHFRCFETNGMLSCSKIGALSLSLFI